MNEITSNTVATNDQPFSRPASEEWETFCSKRREARLATQRKLDVETKSSFVFDGKTIFTVENELIGLDIDYTECDTKHAAILAIALIRFLRSIGELEGDSNTLLEEADLLDVIAAHTKSK